MFDFLKSLLAAPDHSQLTNALQDGAFLVDVRSPGEFSSGSVHGATNIPLERIAHELTRFKGKSAIVVFCRSGYRSLQAKRILETNGFENVINGGTRNHVQRCINSIADH